MTTPTAARTGLAILLMTSLAPASARAQFIGIDQPLRPHLALDVDVGVARDRDRQLWQAFGRVGAGVLWFDGQRLLATTAELGNPWSGRRTLGLGAQFAHIQSGLGATATVLRDLDHGGLGAGLGVSVSLLNVQAVVLTRGATPRTVSFFLRLPLGLLWQVRVLGRRTDQGAAASVHTRPAPAGLQT